MDTNNIYFKNKLDSFYELTMSCSEDEVLRMIGHEGQNLNDRQLANAIKDYVWSEFIKSFVHPLFKS